MSRHLTSIPATGALTDAATIATDASIGNFFSVTIAADRTLGAPTNPSHGQMVTWRVKNSDVLPHTLTLASGAGGFTFGATITGITAVLAGLADYFTAIYNLASDRWEVVGYAKGF